MGHSESGCLRSKLFTYTLDESTDTDTQGNVREMPSGFSSHDLVGKSKGECSGGDIWYSKTRALWSRRMWPHGAHHTQQA